MDLLSSVRMLSCSAEGVFLTSSRNHQATRLSLKRKNATTRGGIIKHTYHFTFDPSSVHAMGRVCFVVGKYNEQEKTA